MASKAVLRKLTRSISNLANPHLGHSPVASGNRLSTCCDFRSMAGLCPLHGVHIHVGMLAATHVLANTHCGVAHCPCSPVASDVTFNVRDFRSMAALCTALGADVTMRLEGPGAPVLVEPHFRGLPVRKKTNNTSTYLCTVVGQGGATWVAG